MGEYFQLAEMLPGFANGNRDRFWRVPDWAFTPDAWTRAFLTGLSKMRPSESLWEVGVGTGLVSFFLRQWFPQAKIYFSDFDCRCTELAIENLCNGSVLNRVFEPLHGSWDLVSNSTRKPPRVKVIVGCIPQALLPKGRELADSDNEAHYYDPVAYPESNLHHLGLGLNEALLARSCDVLLPGGRVVLNLGGRPGLAQLTQMFEQNGFKPKVLHEEIIEQHKGTCLQPFASLESVGSKFEFFGDKLATEPITAAEAERRRLAKEAVFHKIYVIEGTMA